MFSKAQIGNMSIMHFRSTKLINDLDEDSQEAIVCRQFYDVCPSNDPSGSSLALGKLKSLETSPRKSKIHSGLFI